MMSFEQWLKSAGESKLRDEKDYRPIESPPFVLFVSFVVSPPTANKRSPNKRFSGRVGKFKLQKTFSWELDYQNPVVMIGSRPISGGFPEAQRGVDHNFGQ